MNKVKVVICGKEFSLKTDEAPSYLIGLAKEVDAAVYNMLSESNNSISLQSAALLTALAAYDERRKANDSIDNIRTQIKEYVDDACQARLERDEAVKNEKAHLARIAALENELKIKHMKSDIDEQLTFDTTGGKKPKQSHNGTENHK